MRKGHGHVIVAKVELSRRKGKHVRDSEFERCDKIRTGLDRVGQRLEVEPCDKMPQDWTETVRGWKLSHVTRCHRIGQSRSEARGHPFVKKQRVIVNLTSILSELHIPKTVHPSVYSSVFPSVHQSISLAVR